MGATIIVDLLSERAKAEGDGHPDDDVTGRRFNGGATEQLERFVWRTRDADGIVYFVGLADDEADAELMHDWSMAYAGTTSIDLLHSDNTWQEYI